MVIGYINSKWSMPRRLVLISAIFLIPSLVQLCVFSSNKLEQISVLDGEIEGAKLARAIWSQMASDEDIKPGIANSELTALSSSTGQSLSVQPRIDSFVNAKTAAERTRLAVDLLDQVADASALTLDPYMDTYHSQDIVVQRLPRIKQALAGLQDSLGSSASSDAALAMNYSALTGATEEFRKPLEDLYTGDSSGDAKRTLGAQAGQLLAELGDIASKVKAANYHRDAIGPEVKEAVANASTAVGVIARDTSDLFLRLEGVHTSDSRAALYRTLALLLAATIGAIIVVTLISRGVSSRLSNLVRAMDQISRKDLTVDVPYLADSNENGQIAQALARFKEAVVENKANTEPAIEVRQAAAGNERPLRQRA